MAKILNFDVWKAKNSCCWKDALMGTFVATSLQSILNQFLYQNITSWDILPYYLNALFAKAFASNVTINNVIVLILTGKEVAWSSRAGI
jgi:hypothetical protein